MKVKKIIIVLISISIIVISSCSNDSKGFIKPVDGTVFIPFGISKDPVTGLNKEFVGITYECDNKQFVKAALEGTVLEIREDPVNYGLYIILEHKKDFKSLYANLSTISVKKGDTVSRGDNIGETGNSGRACRENTAFFAIYLNNEVVDPNDYLK